MQTAQQTFPTSTWNRSQAEALPKLGVFANVRALSVCAWLICLILPYWYISDWYTRQEMLETGGLNDRKFFYVGFAVMLAAHLTLGAQPWITAPFQMLSTWVGTLLTTFFFLMVMLAPISLVPGTSLLYAGVTWLAVILMWVFWTGNYKLIMRALLIACWLQFAWWCVLLRHHGLIGGFGGIIGDINRNMTGTAVLAAMICGLHSGNRYFRWAAFAAALFFIVIVSSRGSLVALAVFVVVYYALNVGIFRAAAVGGLLGIFVLLFVVAIPDLREQAVEKVFHVHDAARGIGSGFTGRTAMWSQAMEWVWRQPIFGYGFRVTTKTKGVGFGGVHSAYIKIFLEAGFVGGFFIIAAVVLDAVRRMRIVIQLRKLRPQDLPNINLTESLRINVIGAATMCLTLTMWVYDQYYVNLGSAISVVLFLMIAAPSYVTNQGVLLRRL